MAHSDREQVLEPAEHAVGVRGDPELLLEVLAVLDLLVVEDGQRRGVEVFRVVVVVVLEAGQRGERAPREVVVDLELGAEMLAVVDDAVVPAARFIQRAPLLGALAWSTQKSYSTLCIYRIPSTDMIFVVEFGPKITGAMV